MVHDIVACGGFRLTRQQETVLDVVHETGGRIDMVADRMGGDGAAVVRELRRLEEAGYVIVFGDTAALTVKGMREVRLSKPDSRLKPYGTDYPEPNQFPKS